MELAKDDSDKLVEKMGEYNAQRFLSSGVAGIPPSQTYNVKVSRNKCEISKAQSNSSK